jgi:hypothetical protein
MGALRAGWDKTVGIESDPKWCEAARRRISHDAPLLNTEVGDMAHRMTDDELRVVGTQDECKEQALNPTEGAA